MSEQGRVPSDVEQLYQELLRKAEAFEPTAEDSAAAVLRAEVQRLRVEFERLTRDNEMLRGALHAALQWRDERAAEARRRLRQSNQARHIARWLWRLDGVRAQTARGPPALPAVQRAAAERGPRLPDARLARRDGTRQRPVVRYGQQPRRLPVVPGHGRHQCRQRS